MKYTIDRHPLKVYYPYGGRHFVLRWHTHNTQHSIIIVRNPIQLSQILNRILDKNLDIEIREGYEVNIVAPPVSLCENAMVLANRELVTEFTREVCCYMKYNVLDKGRKMPPLFLHCDSWAPKKHYYIDSNGTEIEHIEDTSENDDPKHYDCANCELRVKLSGITTDKFYDLYHDIWHEHLALSALRMENGNQKPYPKAQYSQALIAPSEEGLMFASPEFGNHRQGVYFDKVARNTHEVLFYFYPLSKIDTTKFVDFVNQMNEEAKRFSKEKSRIQKEKLELERRTQVDKLIAIFN